MRFLHLADIHLDTLFSGRRDETRRRLREASREAFRRGLEVARRESVDAVLVAGDLFDGDRLSLATEQFLVRELQTLHEAEIPLLHASGNHDPGSGPASEARLSWVSEIHAFHTAAPRTVPIVRQGKLVGTVTGAGHESERESRDLSRTLVPPADRSVPAVALLHTQVGGARGDGDHARYAPSELQTLRSAGFDYWALGHIHVRQALETLPAIHYPGNTQGRNPGEQGAKGGLLVEIPSPGSAASVRFVELAPIRWETLYVAELDEATSFAALVRRILGQWEGFLEDAEVQGAPSWLLRVELAGPCPLVGLLRDPAEVVTLAEEVAARTGALEVDVRVQGLRPALDPRGARERQDAAGAVLRLAHDLSSPHGSSPSRALQVSVDDLAGPLAAHGLEGGSEALDRYLRELLEGAELELLDRFVAEGEAE